jgi:tetratricopeptide (TPR) repeat protein
MLRRELFLTAILLPALAVPAFAIDEVVRQSEGPVRGNIKAVTSTEVTVESVGQSTKVPVTEIAAVRWDGEPAQLNITRTREANGDLDFALKSYREIAGQVDATQKTLKTDLEFLVARTLARQAIADTSRKDAAIKALNDFVTAHADFFRYYDALQWLGRVHAAAGDFESAKTAYGRVATAPLPAIKMAAQTALARVKLQQDDLAGALADFDAVLAEPGNDLATSRDRFAAKLGRAIVLQRQGNHEEALKTLDEVIQQASADDTVVQAEAFARRGESLEASGKEKDALLAYLHVDILFPSEAGPHAEALYHLSKLWAGAGQAERSADARRRLTEQYPTSEWTRKL